MNVLIDGDIFDLQTRPGSSAPLDGRMLVSNLKRHFQPGNIVVLEREASLLQFRGAKMLSIPTCDRDDVGSMDMDDELLMAVCRDLDADIFLSSGVTRAPGIANVVLLLDVNSDAFRSDSPPGMWDQRFRAYETADAFICPSKPIEKEFLSRFPQYQSRPRLTLTPHLEGDDSQSAHRLAAFLGKIPRRRSILLTAIVSTFNAERFMHGCLTDLVNQTIADRMEIVVVDSASEEGESTIVRNFQGRHPNIKYIRTPIRENVYKAWNRGIKFAQGKYITNANTDDRHRRDALELMVAVMEEDDQIALVYADVIKTRTANETFNHCTPTGVLRWYDWNRQALLANGCFIGPQPVWRKQVHQAYGYFNENYDVSADYEFWLRISQTHHFHHIPRPMGLYMERPDSVEHANADKKFQEDREITHMYQRAATTGKIIGFNQENPVRKSGIHALAAPDNNISNQHADNASRIAVAGTHQGGTNMNSPDTILNAIQYMLEGGQKEAAFWTLDKLLLDFPDHAQLQDQAGMMAYDLGEIETARGHFEAAVNLSPDTAAFRKNLGDFYYVIDKDGEQALAQYQAGLSTEPQNSSLLTLAGHVSISLNRYKKALEYYQRVVDMDPGNQEILEITEKLQLKVADQNGADMTVDEIKAAAKARIDAGDGTGAVDLMSMLLNRDCDQATVHNDLGVLKYELGDLEAARAHYEQATEGYPENDVFQKNLADLYWTELGDHQKAMEAYVQVLKLNPRDIEALLNCGQICIALHKLTDARDFMNAVLEIEPWSEDARQLLEQMENISAPAASQPVNNCHDQPCPNESDQNEPDNPIEGVRQQLALSPDDATLHNNLGVLLYEAGQKENAQASYEEAVRLAPEDANYQKNLADYYFFEKGRPEDAMKLYLRVLNQNPEDVEALNATGLICGALNQVEDARYFFERVLELEPWNDNAAKGLMDLTHASSGTDALSENRCAAG